MMINLLPIIQDTREKQPWDFTIYDECEKQSVMKLDAGDYIIEGRNLIVIDRKKSPSELANNLGIHRERFNRELERMSLYLFKYIVCEFSYDKLQRFPYGCKLPKKVIRKIRIRGNYMIKCVGELEETYEVEFVFCNNRSDAQDMAMELFKKALEYEHTSK